VPAPCVTRFAAPEKLTGKASTTTLAKGDVYSLLLTYLGLLVRQGPFFFMRCLSEGKRLAALFSQPDAQARLEWLLDTYYGPLLPPAALAFFKWGLQVDPQQRPSAAEVLAHPYMQSG
jgi:serine/threonine protein kinase